VFQAFGLIPCKQPLKVVAVGTVAAKDVFVEQALDSAAGADLVGTTLGTDGPTHFAVPATAKNHGRPCETGSHQGPQPPRALSFCRLRLFFHYQTRGTLPTAEYDVSAHRAIVIITSRYQNIRDWNSVRTRQRLTPSVQSAAGEPREVYPAVKLR